LVSGPDNCLGISAKLRTNQTTVEIQLICVIAMEKDQPDTIKRLEL
jgi:hypothetical protein